MSIFVVPGCKVLKHGDPRKWGLQTKFCGHHAKENDRHKQANRNKDKADVIPFLELKALEYEAAEKVGTPTPTAVTTPPSHPPTSTPSI